MDYLKQVKKGLIVSCQALSDEPLHSSYIMSKMALAAEVGGAVGLRANTVADIVAIQKETDLPIIGIVKKDYHTSEVFITPTLDEVLSLAKTSVSAIAMDATNRVRPKNQNIEEIVSEVKKLYPKILLMADISTLDEAVYAEKIGFDIISTTLYGYTKETKGKELSDNDFDFLKEVVTSVDVPVFAEGNIKTPNHAAKALKYGAHSVVVGSAITRPQIITKTFIDAIKQGGEDEII